MIAWYDSHTAVPNPIDPELIPIKIVTQLYLVIIHTTFNIPNMLLFISATTQVSKLLQIPAPTVNSKTEPRSVRLPFVRWHQLVRMEPLEYCTLLRILLDLACKNLSGGNIKEVRVQGAN